jgi:hypothetical protein
VDWTQWDVEVLGSGRQQHFRVFPMFLEHGNPVGVYLKTCRRAFRTEDHVKRLKSS